MLSPIMDRHLRVLSAAYRINVSTDGRWIEVHRFRLPSGYNVGEISILIQIPQDYPLSPPGFPNGLFVPQGLRFRNRSLMHVHENSTPGWGAWAWLCYHSLEWNPHRDDLVRFLEMIRADLSNPGTR